MSEGTNVEKTEDEQKKELLDEIQENIDLLAQLVQEQKELASIS